MKNSKNLSKTFLKVGLAVTAVLAIICYLCTRNILNYKKADKLFSEGRYQDAASVFEQLANESYRDSSEKFLKCKYFLAKAYDSSRNYELAYSVFSGLEDYEDSAFLAHESLKHWISTVSIGDTFFYGSYEQDGIEQDGIEPIQWTVLGTDGDNILLISNYVLETRTFNTEVCDWSACSLRAWMNSEFFNAAFSEKEKENIQKMITSDVTTDFVFCLSADEARKFFSSDEARAAELAQAVCMGRYIPSYEDPGCWWTRSAGYDRGIIVVNSKGDIYGSGRWLDEWNDGDNVGVRPAIVLSSSPSPAAQNMCLFGINSDTDLHHEPKPKGNSYSSNSKLRKCGICNGTGYVKYYYGSSDLEALLSGHDPYTYGICTNCNGTGKVRG